MCRLFGFRSVIESQVHKSLLGADNAILHQSGFHSDGWGVSYYVAKSPHVIKSISQAMHDSLFRKVSGIVASQTVLAHLRKATQGNLCITNTHPFQHGHWTFVHNGNLMGFQEKKDLLLRQVSPLLRRYILGETDSEVLFYLLLSHLSRRVPLHNPGCSLDDLFDSIEDCLLQVHDILGPFHPNDDGPSTQNYWTFILTDGASMVGFHGGKTLYYSTFKRECSEAERCPSYNTSCENPTSNGFVNHLLFSSEPLKGENTWQPLSPGTMLGVDWNMKLGQRPLFLPPHSG